jgi:hypothetical protein
MSAHFAKSGYDIACYFISLQGGLGIFIVDIGHLFPLDTHLLSLFDDEKKAFKLYTHHVSIVNRIPS